MVLLDHVSRDALAGLLGLGVDALLVRSARPEEVADAVRRVVRGERVVAPALLPLLVGVLGSMPDAEQAESDGLLTRKELEVLGRLLHGPSPPPPAPPPARRHHPPPPLPPTSEAKTHENKRHALRIDVVVL